MRMVRGEGLRAHTQHLSLDAVEASEPEYLASAQLSFSMVNLLLILSQLILSHLICAWPRTCLFQTLQVTGGHCGNDLEHKQEC